MEGNKMAYRVPDKEDVRAYKKWARENYTPLDDIRGIWHPVIQLECAMINILSCNNGKEILEVLSAWQPEDDEDLTVAESNIE